MRLPLAPCWEGTWRVEYDARRFIRPADSARFRFTLAAASSAVKAVIGCAVPIPEWARLVAPSALMGAGRVGTNGACLASLLVAEGCWAELGAALTSAGVVSLQD